MLYNIGLTATVLDNGAVYTLGVDDRFGAFPSEESLFVALLRFHIFPYLLLQLLVSVEEELELASEVQFLPVED